MPTTHGTIVGYNAKVAVDAKHKLTTADDVTILRQICIYIPVHEVTKIARVTGAEDKSRTFNPWSHVVSLLYGQPCRNGRLSGGDQPPHAQDCGF